MKLTCILILSFLSLSSIARDQLIYSVGHELPMGGEEINEIKKNYYITAGTEQGINKGAILDVYRIISQVNHYDKQERVNYRVKIGQIEVIETSTNASIGIARRFDVNEKTPILEVKNFMVGDHVAVKVDG